MKRKIKGLGTVVYFIIATVLITLVTLAHPEFTDLNDNYNEVAAAFGWEEYPGAYESGVFVLPSQN